MMGFAAAGIFAAVASTAARADTFVWQDPSHGYTMSFPDSWTMQTQDQSNTELRIAGPIGEDLATCRMQVTQDGRLKIYPKRLMTQAVYETMGRDYWDREVGQFLNPNITAFYAPASMGDKGDATAIHVSFRQMTGEDTSAHMHGIMIGSIYGDKRYVASCSSRAEMYDRYADLFMSILDSVKLDSRYHPFATGYYRNFLIDPKFVLPRSKPGTVSERGDYFDRWFGKKYHYND